MIKMKSGTGLVIVGFLMGLLLGAPVAHAAVEYLNALPSQNAIYVDGEQIQMEAYTINGNNYVKLRDIGAALDFNVYWDGTVQIDSASPYTGEAPEHPQQDGTSAGEGYTISEESWSREDFSRQANPAVFTGVYDRALYNAIRQTLVDQGQQDEAGYRYAYTMVSGEQYSAVKNVLGRLEGILRYEFYVPQDLANYYEYPDYFAVSAAMPENYQAAWDFVQPVIKKAETLSTDSAKVQYLNDYLCSLLEYDSTASAGIIQTFSDHDGELDAACGSYARAFKFLCAAADLPCITISTATHTWNLVYADGRWLHVDVSLNDLPGDGGGILLAEAVPNRTDRAPEATAFLQELLVPGSTM